MCIRDSYLVSKHGGLKKKIDPFFSDFLVCSDSLAKCCIQAKGLMRNRTEKSERGELRRGRVEEHFLTSAHTKMLFNSPSSFPFFSVRFLKALCVLRRRVAVSSCIPELRLEENGGGESKKSCIFATTEKATKKRARQTCSFS